MIYRMIIAIIFSIVMILFIVGGSSYIVVELIDHDHVVLSIVALLIACALVIFEIYFISMSIDDANESIPPTRTITIHDEAGNVMARYEGDISDVVYCDGYIQFDYDDKEYVYQNCLVEMVKEE